METQCSCSEAKCPQRRSVALHVGIKVVSPAVVQVAVEDVLKFEMLMNVVDSEVRRGGVFEWKESRSPDSLRSWPGLDRPPAETGVMTTGERVLNIDLVDDADVDRNVDTRLVVVDVVDGDEVDVNVRDVSDVVGLSDAVCLPVTEVH
eukprot:2581307-Amphidinium_carterae.3